MADLLPAAWNSTANSILISCGYSSTSRAIVSIGARTRSMPVADADNRMVSGAS